MAKSIKKLYDGKSTSMVAELAVDKRVVVGIPTRTGEALFPRIRRKVLALFLLNPEKRFYFREVARLIGDTPASIQREMKTLTQAGILLMEPIGVQKFYWANRSHPVFSELKGIAEKTFGLVDKLRDALDQCQGKIDMAFVFGSIATGRETGKSDIDLLVIGSVSLRDLVGILDPLEKTTNRPINPTLFSKSEFLSRVKKKDHFVSTLLSSEKLFIIGNADDLERLA